MTATHVHVKIELEFNKHPTARYLADADGNLTTDPEKALSFLVRVPRGIDGTSIERKAGAVADKLQGEATGKLSAWVDLQRGISGLRGAIRSAIEKELWPEGKPEARDADLRAQEERIGQRWAEIVKEARAGGDLDVHWNYLRLEALMGQQDSVRFFARWSVLLEAVRVGGVERPELLATWKALEETGASYHYGVSIRGAFEEALEQVQPGNGVPSDS